MPKKLPVEKLCFVQFLHPGGEHRPDDGSLKNWNTGPQKRKFARIAGKLNEQTSASRVSELWHTTVKQVRDQGLWLGAQVRMPPRRCP